MTTRWILLAHAVVVAYTGAVVQMDRVGTFWIVNEESVNDYTMAGKIVFDLATLLSVTIFLFPVLIGITLYNSRPPRSMTLTVIAEMLLEFAHLAVVIPFSH